MFEDHCGYILCFFKILFPLKGLFYLSLEEKVFVENVLTDSKI
jgi:hypothetical protein